MSVQAIARSTFQMPHGGPLVEKGVVVSAADEAFDVPRAKALFIMQHDPRVRFWTEAHNFLPLDDLLQRQPLHDFWVLLHVESLRSHQIFYLACPSYKDLGNKPFRFESEGELFYVAGQRKLNLKLFYIMHFRKDFEIPSWWRL